MRTTLQGCQAVYADWREMLDREGKNLDCVNVSTPDHMHACMGMSAMQMGLHLYGQKPLTHDVAESRMLAEYAKKNRLITQMGIQIHSSKQYRTAVQLVHDGVIGKIKEAHSFSGKRWGDSNPKPPGEDPIPEGLDWDAWIGPAPYTKYLKVTTLASGENAWTCGTGTFGDMGCHIYDPTFKALGLTYPISSDPKVQNQTGTTGDSMRKFTISFLPPLFLRGIAYPSPGTTVPPKPPQEVISLLEGNKLPGQGSVIIGTKGTMLLPHVGMPPLSPKGVRPI